MKNGIFIIGLVLTLAASCSQADFFEYEKGDYAYARVIASSDGAAYSGNGSIRDSGFNAFCVATYDADGDGVVTEKEIEGVTSVDCSGQGITTLEGISAFKSLETLVCDNNSLTFIDFGKMPRTLRSLSCKGNLIREMNICDFPLDKLWCKPMNDASGKNVLQFIYLRVGQELSVLDVPDDTYIIDLP